MNERKLESGNFYWTMQNAEQIWRPCYIAEDSDEQLWIDVLGVDFHMPLHMVSLEHFTFIKMHVPWTTKLPITKGEK
jgi:hypothetical protein